MITRKRAAPTESLCVGRVVQTTEEGRALVDFPGNPLGPIEARTVVTAPPAVGGADGLPVLLTFENGDRSLPIIVGIVQDVFSPPAASAEWALTSRGTPDVIVDGRKVSFSAKEEIVLSCGQGSITLRKDGKIIIKGTNLVSRSSGTNKVQGATVRLN